jgi:zinc protease
MYGAGHAYGKPASGYEKSVEAITRDDLAKWHADWFRPGSATIIVTGDTTLAKVMPQLEAAFGKWKAGSAPAKQVVAVPPTQGKRVFLIDKPNAPQSVIVATHVSAMQGLPTDLAMEPVMQNFGGMATSRMNRNLRLEKHWSYGTAAQLTNVRGQRGFFVVAPVQTDKTRESMVEVDKEIRGVVGARPLVGEEYNSIMRNMTARLAGRFETLAALENAALTSINLRHPDNYWSNYARSVRGLTEQQLNDAAKVYIKPDEVVWMVIGDIRKIEQGVRELNFGEVTILNADGQPVAR